MQSKKIKRVGHVSLSFTLPNQNEGILIFGGYVEVINIYYPLDFI